MTEVRPLSKAPNPQLLPGRRNVVFFVCCLHLTHPSAHTLGSVGVRPGSSWGFGALLKGLTSVMDDSCRSRDSIPQPQVTSPTLYPLGHDCPDI